MWSIAILLNPNKFGLVSIMTLKKINGNNKMKVKKRKFYQNQYNFSLTSVNFEEFGSVKLDE